MSDEDYASADAQVMGMLMTNLDGLDTAHIMKTIEKFGVTSEWFNNERYRVLFDAVIETWKKTQTLDVFHLRQNYPESDFAQLTCDIVDNYHGTAAHLEYYLGALKNRRVYTMMHKMMTETMKEMKPDTIGIQMEDFVKSVHDLQEKMAESDNGLRQIGDFMAESVATKEKLHEERFVKHNWTYLDGQPWPWNEVNMIFSGLNTGLHVIGALASQGKSTMAADLSVFWNTRGIKHGYISIDMAAEQFVDRYPCIAGLVSLSKLNFGGSAEDVAKFKKGFAQQAKFNNVWISEADDTKTIEYQCYRGVRSLGWKAIIIDYIQLVTYNEGKGNLPEYTRVQRCVQEVKKIAKKLKVPVICLAQLSRAFEKELRDTLAGGKGTPEPGLDAIGDSAEIARAASSVTVLYQDENVRKYWKVKPPTQLAFGDKMDCAWNFGVVDRFSESDEEAEARRDGQLSLAKALRPVWFEVLKNQQGGKGKIPMVMFPNYFLFRPGNSEGETVEVEIDGKKKKLPIGQFEQLRDDWIYTEQDWWLEMTNAMPQRGPRITGETYAEMRKRQAMERAAHPEVKHFVREYDEKGRNETGWHWEEAGRSPDHQDEEVAV